MFSKGFKPFGHQQAILEDNVPPPNQPLHRWSKPFLNCFAISSFLCCPPRFEFLFFRKKNIPGNSIRKKVRRGRKSLVAVESGTYSHSLCVNCHLKIYNEESIESGKTLPHYPQHYFHILLNIQLSRLARLLPVFIGFSFTFFLSRVAITSLSLNRKTIDAVNLFHKRASPRRRLPYYCGQDERKREIKDKVNRLAGVECSEKPLALAGARNKKRIFEGLSA